MSSKNTEFKLIKNLIKVKTKTNLSSNEYYKKIPSCSYVLGELIGFIEELTGKRYIGKETKCISLGHKYDKFVIEKIN